MIDVQRLSVTYPARRRQPARAAVRDIDLRIHPGQFVALLGPNGSGKSSLIRAIARLVPFTGEVRVDGQSNINKIRQSLGVVLQSPSLDPHMTMRENLLDLAALHGIPRSLAHDRVTGDLQAGDLSTYGHTLVKRLSGGLKRRADLIRALLHRPRVLLLDEPTVGLDPPSRIAFLTALEVQRQQRELTILFSSHLTDEADRCDRVIFMHEGRLVADNAPDALRRALGKRRLTVHAPSQPAVPGEWRRTHEGWTTPLAENPEEVAKVTIALTSENAAFTIAPPTLADAFETLTGTTLERVRHE